MGFGFAGFALGRFQPLLLTSSWSFSDRLLVVAYYQNFRFSFETGLFPSRLAENFVANTRHRLLASPASPASLLADLQPVSLSVFDLSETPRNNFLEFICPSRPIHCIPSLCKLLTLRHYGCRHPQPTLD